MLPDQDQTGFSSSSSRVFLLFTASAGPLDLCLRLNHDSADPGVAGSDRVLIPAERGGSLKNFLTSEGFLLWIRKPVCPKNVLRSFSEKPEKQKLDEGKWRPETTIHSPDWSLDWIWTRFKSKLNLNWIEPELDLNLMGSEPDPDLNLNLIWIWIWTGFKLDLNLTWT